MNKEEDFFKENFPEYVTEKGEFLSPYGDLFSAGVIFATFELKKENTELKEKLNKLARVAEVRLANWQMLDEENEKLKMCNRELTTQVASLNRCLEKQKSFLKQWLQIAQKNNTRCYGFVKDTEQFLKDLEK